LTLSGHRLALTWLTRHRLTLAGFASRELALQDCFGSCLKSCFRLRDRFRAGDLLRGGFR
jgi:hypothetical protein